MKHLLFIIVLAILCAATSFGQTIKTLGFNTTNGQVVANTGTNVLTFTNPVNFGGDMVISNSFVTYGSASIDLEEAQLEILGSSVFQWSDVELTASVPLAFNNTTNAATTRASLGFSTNLNTLWTSTNSSNARSAVGLGATWLTNTNVTNFRTAIGLGASNEVTLEAIVGGSRSINVVNGEFMGAWYFDDSVSFGAPNVVRTNVGLPLAALTNTSNVTAMRALSGSTNTNHPFSGSVALTNTNTLVFSNGILQSVQ
jgi:hypothetical protein